MKRKHDSRQFLYPWLKITIEICSYKCITSNFQPFEFFMQISKFKVTFNGCNYEVSRPTKQAGNCVKSQLEGSFNRNMLWGEHRSLALDDGLGTKFKFQSSSIFQGEIINWNTLICLLFQSFFHGTWYFCWFFHLDVDHDSRSSNRCTNLLEFMFFF